jgi:hypothetical protein
VSSDAEGLSVLAERIARVERRLGELEGAMGGLADEVRTRQLIVVDEEDRPRIVGEVFGDAAELRIELPGAGSISGPELVLFGVSEGHPTGDELGAAVGFQLRANGQALFEVDAVPSAGRWRPGLHLNAF